MLTSVDVKFTSIVHLLREIVHKGLLRSANILQIADVVRRNVILSCKCKVSYSQTLLILKLKGSKKESVFTGCP